MATASDSWMAWSGHVGSLVPTANFPIWSYSPILRCSVGQADGGVYGLQADWTGIDERGYTPLGILTDKIRELVDPDFLATVGYEGAFPGTQVAEWRSNIPAPGPNYLNPLSGRWAGLAPYIVANDNGVLWFTGPGNDILAAAASTALTINPIAAGWDTLIDDWEQDVRDCFDYVLTLNPTWEIVWPTYANFLVQDVPARRYPARNPTHSLPASVWATSGFGFYGQQEVDRPIEVTRWATAEWKAEIAARGYDPDLPANLDVAFPIFGQFYNSTVGPPYFRSLRTRPYWWPGDDARRGAYETQLNLALANDLLGSGTQVLNLDPEFFEGAFGNITNETVNRLFQYVHDEIRSRVTPDYPRVISIDAWRSIPPSTTALDTWGTPEQYAPGDEALWIEGIHLNDNGYRLWLDFVIAEWAERSYILRTLVEPGERRRTRGASRSRPATGSSRRREPTGAA